MTFTTQDIGFLMLYLTGGLMFLSVAIIVYSNKKFKSDNEKEKDKK